MSDLPTAAELTGLASMLAPGLIIIGLRTRFQNGSLPDLKDQIIGYAVASTAYYAAATPLFGVSRGIALPPWAWQSCQYFLLPCLIGFAVARFDRTEWLYRACARSGLRLSYHIPAAWDYAFTKLTKGAFVLVRLTDGTLYAGKLASRSFASSSADERDLYLEEVWDAEAVPWTQVTPRRGVLLCGKDIKWIEIFERT